MYEKDALLGKVLNLTHIPENDLKNRLFQLFLVGRQSCNHSYRTTRSIEKGTCSSEYILIVTVSGKGILKTENREYFLSNGSFALIDGSRYSEFYPEKNGKWDFYFFHFNYIHMPEFYEYIKKHDKLVETLPATLLISHSIENIMKIKLEHKGNIDIKISRIISGIIHNILDVCQEVYRPEPLINDIVQYFHEFYREKIELQDIANRFYINKNYLCNLFRKELGVTPYTFLTKVRVAESKKMLSGSANSIKQIAKQCGFSTSNNYINTFKRLEGTTPNKFRKAVQKREAVSPVEPKGVKKPGIPTGANSKTDISPVK